MTCLWFYSTRSQPHLCAFNPSFLIIRERQGIPGWKVYQFKESNTARDHFKLLDRILFSGSCHTNTTSPCHWSGHFWTDDEMLWSKLMNLLVHNSQWLFYLTWTKWNIPVTPKQKKSHITRKSHALFRCFLQFHAFLPNIYKYGGALMSHWVIPNTGRPPSLESTTRRPSTPEDPETIRFSRTPRSGGWAQKKTTG